MQTRRIEFCGVINVTRCVKVITEVIKSRGVLTMKKVICLTVTFLIFGFSIFLGGCSKKAQEGVILAEFDGQVVTIDELEQEISELSSYKQKKYKDQAGREEYLVLMAESRMLLRAAIDSGLDKDEKILQETQDYKDQLIVKEFVKREVDDKAVLIDGDLSKYYEEHKEDYLIPEKVVVTEISVKDEETAKEIMKKIKAGADYTELAKEMDAKGETFGPGKGNEGKTNPFSRSQFSNAPKFAETCFGLELGQISDIIVQPLRDETFYMIARLDERIEPKQQELSEVEKRVNRIVQKEKKKERMDKWLEGLKVENDYKLYPERIPEVVEPEEETEEKAAETADETVDEQKTPDEAETTAESEADENEKPDEAEAADESGSGENEKPDEEEKKPESE